MIDKVLRVLALLSFLLLSFKQNAQPVPGPPPANAVPITGIEILISAGALLGSKLMLTNRKTNS